ncbi:MAG: inorganic phosphate transporter [Armatimonadetes bacterium]|nr:inorganic phosphate transporter [Armatimonadota bacterium]
MDSLSSLGLGTVVLLVICLVIALGFEFVNGFHDTANAVATVIYTKSLRPHVAVIWSGLMNFLGVLLGGTAVAFSIVHLLPVDLIVNIGATSGILMIFSLLVTAVLWNVATWYFGIPSSSSHTLIGSILGVGLMSSLFAGHIGSGVNWTKAQQIGLSLLISPLIGFCCAGALLLVAKAFIKDKKLYEAPEDNSPPPFWIRSILCITCTGVSFAHGSNDGQKGMGLIMLILMGIMPSQYALNPAIKADAMSKAVVSLQKMESILQKYPDTQKGKWAKLPVELAHIRTTLTGKSALSEISPDLRKSLRADILKADELLGKLDKSGDFSLTREDKETLKQARKQIVGMVDFVALWVVIAVAVALGLGTTIGWKRIATTIGEHIGKTHMTYAQGASAELVAMLTIASADLIGLPVSTTHVLSSGVAGTMVTNRSGLQFKTVRNILLAWVLTLPVTIAGSALLFYVISGGSIKREPPVSPAPIVKPVKP